MKLATAVRRALTALDPAPADKGAGELAVTYAAAIDDGADLDTFGPLLLTTLDALGLTPKARAAMAKKGGARGTAGDPIDELRARRATRTNRTQTVDT